MNEQLARIDFLNFASWGAGAATAARVVLIAVAAWILVGALQRLFRIFRERLTARMEDREQVKRAQTLGRAFRYLAAVVVSLIAGMLILAELGVSVAPILGDRVGIVITNRRAIGIDGGSGNLVEHRLLPRERVVVTQVGANVAVVVTDRSALGLSPLRGGFFPVKLDVSERIESITASSNVATLTTDRRILIFRTPTGTWEERTRNLR